MEQIVIQSVALQEGQRKDGSGMWQRWTVTDEQGRKLSTFDEAFGSRAKAGTAVRVDIEEKDLGGGRKVKNITSFEFVENGNGDRPAAYTHSKPTGEPDWDKKDLTITRCGLWNNYLSGYLASNVYAKAVASDVKDPVERVLIIGAELVSRAERDIFERAPGDDAVPFRTGNELDQGQDVPI